MTRDETAVQLFEQGFFCAQAVLGAFAPSLGLDADTAARIASAFGAGMGYTAGTCGAVTAAYMVLGLKHGFDKPDDPEAKERITALVQEFNRQFIAKTGALTCRELLGADLSRPDGLARARDEKRFETVCPPLIAAACRILDAMLQLRRGKEASTA